MIRGMVLWVCLPTGFKGYLEKTITGPRIVPTRKSPRRTNSGSISEVVIELVAAPLNVDGYSVP